MARRLISTRILRLLVIAAIFVPITIFIVQVDFRMVFAELTKIGWKFFMLIGVTFVAYLLGTLGWWVCLGTQRRKITVTRLFMIRQVGETVGLYNPTSVIGGDVLKNELLKPYGISTELTTRSIVGSRISVVLSRLMLLTLAIIWLMSNMDWISSTYVKYGLWVFLNLLAVGQIVLFFWLSRTSKTTGAHVEEGGYFRRWVYKVRDLAVQARCFYQQQSVNFWLSYLLFALHWLVGSMEFYYILSFLGYNIPLMESLLLDMGVIAVKSLGAFIPGQLGIEELGNKLVLAVIGIQAVSVWLVVSVLRRARQVFWIFIGLICYVLVRKPDTLKLFNYGNPVRQS